MSANVLKLKRFRQRPGECATAAAACVANYYNNDIDYRSVRSATDPDGNGLYTPEIGILLNKLGFQKVTIVSADIRQLDFQWKKMKKETLIKKLKHSGRWTEWKESSKAYAEFLSNENYDNNLIIDLHFGKYIRKALLAKKPVLASFNWNLFFKFPKWNDYGKRDAFKGSYEEHEVVITGYDTKGVYVLDSHHEMYRGKLAKFKSGKYKIDWETLHTVMGFGDLIIPDKYDENKISDELV